MPELLDRITTKVGPLPAWAWAAIPAGGYVAWSYYKAAQGDSVISDEEESTGGALGTEEFGYGLNEGGVYLPGYGSTPAGSSNLPPVDTPDFDNAAWFKLASNWMISEGIPATDAITALNAYLFGFPTTITQAQFNALQRAITHLGAAPDGGFIPTVAAAPTPTPTPTPTPVNVPGAPTNVQAKASGTTTAIVTWGPPQSDGGAAITGYKIEQWQKPATGWKVVHTKLALGSARTISFPVQRAVWNTFRVYATNSKGYGPHAYQSLRIP